MSLSRHRPYHELTTVKTWWAATLAAVVGLGLLYLSGLDTIWAHLQALQAVVSALGVALIVSVALSLVWQLAGKRAFAQEILETTRTSADVEAAGLARIGNRYLDDPDWEQLFRTVRKLDVFVAYAQTWRHSNMARLRTLADRHDARIRLYLPDPQDTETLRMLAQRFSQTQDELAAAIQEARREFENLSHPDGAAISVYYRRGDMLFSCYRFDGTAVLTLYSHSQERIPGVPTLVVADGGSLYQYVRDELQAIHQQSRPATDPTNQQGDPA